MTGLGRSAMSERYALGSREAEFERLAGHSEDARFEWRFFQYPEAPCGFVA